MAEIRFCSKPFDFCEIDREGNVWVCCQDWLATPIGNLLESSFDQVWNSPMAQAIRQSILDGSYKYCNATTCPSLVQRSLPTHSEVRDQDHRKIIAHGRTHLKRGPRMLNLGYDNSCNLKCPTCRTEFIHIKGPAFSKAERLQEIVLRDAFPSAREVIITGHGDAFGSEIFRRLLCTLDAKSFPNLSILLMTNGLMFTPMMWDKMAACRSAISGVSVSVDAATAETYRINRGGSFSKLTANLEFMASLLRQEAIGWFELSFVVQANNFRELPLFIELAARLGCTSVLIQRLIRWPQAMSVEQYNAAAVHEPCHPDHAEFQQTLRALQPSPAWVDFSNLQTFLE